MAADPALPLRHARLRLILLLVPLTYSVSHGIGYGFIAFVAIKVLERRADDVHPLMYAAAGAFVVYFAVA